MSVRITFLAQWIVFVRILVLQRQDKQLIKNLYHEWALLKEILARKHYPPRQEEEDATSAATETKGDNAK